MPRNLSAWIDLTIHLLVMLVLIGVLSYYNFYIAAIAGVVWLALASFARERCADRSRRFERYCRNVVRNINEMLNYAVDELPQAIMVVNEEGRLQWCNDRIKAYLGEKPEQDVDVKDFWPGLIIAPVWGQEGEYVFAHNDRYYHVYYHPVQMAPRQDPLMTLYIQDVTSHEQLKTTYQQSRTVLVYIQIDNYDEVMQGQTEAERTSLLLAVNQTLDKWMKNLGGFMRRVSDDLYVVILTRQGLDQALNEKFDVLDKARQLQSTNRLPVTLSMGVAVAENQTMAELGAQAQAGLDLALGRGGDQVAVQMNGKTQFFGGRAKAVEKHTRVKARVVAHAVREIMEGADEIYIMGHHNEDFDCFGAAMGVAKMARQLDKPYHIVLSDMNDGIDKFHDLLKDKEEYEGVFVHAEDIKTSTALNPVLIVVDTHIPHLVADPTLLERVPQVVVIDHHRRSENFIKSPLLVYIEPGASSTSELITELLMYFGEDIRLGRLDATALYSGIVVDTKNFAVQTGVRTFDAAAFLRRSGADPVMVRHLFRSDYDTTVALARTKARAELFPGGLIVSTIPETISNIQVIAAQAADSLLRIENVRMSILIFQLTEDTVGLSARSTGELNVQVIMEAFGGGGHQNVAGAQVKDGSIDEIKAKVIEISENYIEENDQDESDSAAGR
ncbi:MAG: DHH family phosphoesterase [Selenomonas sp.]|uniref:DHH family phosphoesterase n=1 Tax=Selenomonas sp. TaxID=2053611 RepID=UPI0025CF3F83|nr:DHH family phosphoesterase [Selenomonas sp.]MCR5758371.1 DHH family phosphoesterase [Selenomonas sp.]